MYSCASRLSVKLSCKCLSAMNWSSVFLPGIRVPMVERTRRRNTFEVRGREFKPSSIEQFSHLCVVIFLHRFLARIRAEALDFASDINTGFVQRITQMCAGVAADNEIPSLRHEAGHVT